MANDNKEIMSCSFYVFIKKFTCSSCYDSFAFVLQDSLVNKKKDVNFLSQYENRYLTCNEDEILVFITTTNVEHNSFDINNINERILKYL